MPNHIHLQSITNAIGAHGAWKLKLKTAINLGTSSVTPAQAKCSECCEFGKWLNGPTIDAATRASMPYKVVRRLHTEFHDTAGKVLGSAVSGRKSEADALFTGEYTERSDKLLRALSKWKGEISAVPTA